MAVVYLQTETFQEIEVYVPQGRYPKNATPEMSVSQSQFTSSTLLQHSPNAEKINKTHNLMLTSGEYTMGDISQKTHLNRKFLK